MLTGLKVSSLVSKCIFYRPDHNPKGGPRGIEYLRSGNGKIEYTNR